MDLAGQVAGYYAARAEEYDLSAGYMDSAAEECRARIRSRFQDALGGHDVLEIACGTGYWTQAIAVTARSVLATDLDAQMISQARGRLSALPNVRCLVADAYSLDTVSGHFTAAFSHWWWSHIPKQRIRRFLGMLHSKLAPAALVIFADQLSYDAPHRRIDDEGNLLEERVLRSGQRYEIVKNFPTEDEVVRALSGIAEHVAYKEYREEGYWALVYNTGAGVAQQGCA